MFGQIFKVHHIYYNTAIATYLRLSFKDARKFALKYLIKTLIKQSASIRVDTKLKTIGLIHEHHHFNSIVVVVLRFANIFKNILICQ